MTRLEKFDSFKNHPMLSREYNKLTKANIALCEAFLIETAALDNSSYVLRVNRMFVDSAEKPRHWIAINELLLSARH